MTSSPSGGNGSNSGTNGRTVSETGVAQVHARSHAGSPVSWEANGSRGILSFAFAVSFIPVLLPAVAAPLHARAVACQSLLIHSSTNFSQILLIRRRTNWIRTPCCARRPLGRSLRRLPIGDTPSRPTCTRLPIQTTLRRS